MTASKVEVEIGKVETWPGVIKTFRFALAGILGFGVTELVLTLGILALYGKLILPHASFSSPTLLGLDVLSLVVGVSVSFLINERITVKMPHAGPAEGETRFIRFLKFQGVSGIGNIGIIVVQFFLLAALSVSPVLGAIVGAIVTYPVVYSISVRYVWQGHHIR